ncbi:transglutaminase-like domain-containing protein [Haloplasma contractile]|uniref:Chemotaxis protein CheD n=1 Tax=Haloplasma contractile SSD-17B TaxID=1033810 RepID=F7PUH1_9MOLU|nr:transglutaminase domain-containing protein [Haloplasma contractile]ERJ11681.1 chemotaxis protein CheD [Haloplasma contractile SSD-17B]
MIKTKSLIIGGSIIIGTSFMMIVYLSLISLGVIQTIQNSIVIETKSLEVSYDGREHKMEEFALKSGKLQDGHKVVVNNTASLTNAGETKNTADVKIVDVNENDVSRKYNVEITFGTIRVLKRSIEFSTSNHQKIYDGTPIDNNQRKLTIKSGTLIPGHSVTQRILGSFTNVSIVENRIEVIIYDERGNDVTNNYNTHYSYGILEIQKAPITIKSYSANKVYDGFPLVADGYDIIKNTPIQGHQIIVDVVGKITDVGKIDNEMHVYVLDENLNDVSNYYEINLLTGTLEILKSLYSANTVMKEPNIPDEEVVMTVYGDKTDTVYLRDLSFGNYTGLGFEYATSYDYENRINPLSYSSQALTDHNFSTNELTITFIRKNIPYLTPYFSVDNKNIGDDLHVYGEYSGQPYTTNYISYYFNDNDHLNIKDPNIQIEEMNYSHYVSETYLQIDQTTKLELLNFAANGGIERDSSSLIQDIQLLIQNSAEYNMNFTPIPGDVDNIVLHFLKVSPEGICQHFASAGVMMYRAFGIPARYVTGYLANVKKNETTLVTNLDAHAWVEIYIGGMGWIPIEVTSGLGEPPVEKTEVFVEPKDKQGIYDGNPLVATAVTIEGFDNFIDQGYYYEVIFGGSQVEPGESNSYIQDIFFYDPNGNDVTDEFSIATGEGKLKVMYKKITLTTGDYSEVYKNDYVRNQDNTNYTIVEGLMDGHYEVVDFTSQQKNVGSSSNLATIRIFDENGHDVTDLYLIINDFGELKVTPREIVIETASASKQFDGKVLIAHQYKIVSGSLNDGEVFKEEDFVYKGLQQGYGSSDNIIDIDSINIYNGEINVTSNYSINVIYGRLTISH